VVGWAGSVAVTCPDVSDVGDILVVVRGAVVAGVSEAMSKLATSDVTLVCDY